MPNAGLRRAAEAGADTDRAALIQACKASPCCPQDIPPLLLSAHNAQLEILEVDSSGRGRSLSLARLRCSRAQVRRDFCAMKSTPHNFPHLPHTLPELSNVHWGTQRSRVCLKHLKHLCWEQNPAGLLQINLPSLIGKTELIWLLWFLVKQKALAMGSLLPSSLFSASILHVLLPQSL